MMQRYYITIPDEYQLLPSVSLSGDICLFSMRTRVDMSDDDFNFDAHMDDLLFDKGMLTYNTRTNTAAIYYFEQKRVFSLSESCSRAPVVFYASCSEDYRLVYFYKRDLITGISNLVHTLDTRLLDIDPLTAPLALHDFYTLNERYALISYMAPGRKTRYERYDALLDSLTGELVYFTANEMLRYMECMQPYDYAGQDYLWIKTGEHMVHERKQDWIKGEQEPEEIILAEVEQFIAMVLHHRIDLTPFVLHSSQPNEAFTDYITVDGKIIVLIEQFDSKDSALLIHDIRQQTTDRIAQPRIYNRIYHKQGRLYAREQMEQSNILYDLQTGSIVFDIAEPQQIIALCEQGVLTTDMRLDNEDNTIYLHTDHKTTVFVEGHYFINYEQDFILFINGEEQ
ncbi:hypothetical protein [Paenibacillus wulumuqiensis]|uniref:hypothetical protein n=1 Tax=Paenibacillus wulumuqiensis TaxID=1567107 RepID=UPI0006192A24|nr:hypothetical protein [Paenibacillus wulumuqiensis]